MFHSSFLSQAFCSAASGLPGPVLFGAAHRSGHPLGASNRLTPYAATFTILRLTPAEENERVDAEARRADREVQRRVDAERQAQAEAQRPAEAERHLAELTAELERRRRNGDAPLAARAPWPQSDQPYDPLPELRVLHRQAPACRWTAMSFPAREGEPKAPKQASSLVPTPFAGGGPGRGRPAVYQHPRSYPGPPARQDPATRQESGGNTANYTV